MSLRYPVIYNPDNQRVEELQDADTQPPSIIEGLMGRNRVINGDLSYWQRGTSQAMRDTGFAPLYLAPDRFYMAAATTQVGMSRQSFALGQTDVPGGPRYFIRYSVSSVPGSSSLGYGGHTFEGVDTFAGVRSTLCFWARSITGPRNLGLSFVQSFGSGGSADVNTVLPVVSLTTQWQFYVVPVYLPSVSGKILGSNDHLRLRMWMDVGSNYTDIAGAVGQQSGDFDFALLQFEAGTIDRPRFEFRHSAHELILCQRYYEKSYNLGTAPGTATRVGGHAAELQTGYLLSAPVVRFSQRKRTSPAIIVYNTSDGTAGQISENDVSGQHRINHPALLDAIGSMSFEAYVGNGTGTPNNVARFQWTADAEL
ncbi:hypothetical protein [Stenotrophomonas maltophilia]|uniref:hypothetical protein n=1 Tax=Stenotrophomonas maltophilia TaxID=40324 RepID=UPI0007F865C2|nr:hypothetical protein [Stenotrophomonas maltophilia]OBU70217.1 hypothetical protein A9J40_01740 [Stenotrophomonas maltophilia]